MNGYGKTKCPQCGQENTMYRPPEELGYYRIFDQAKCCNCDHEYLHSEQLKKGKSNEN